MVKQLLKIRWLQIKRMLRELGLLYFFLLLFAIAVLITQFLPAFDNPILVMVLFLQIILSIHVSRKDAIFLGNALSNPRQLYWLEYGLLGIFPLVYLIVQQEWLLSSLLILGISVIPLLKFRFRGKRSLFSLPNQWLSKGNFEWKAGIRKSGLLLAFLQIASIIGLAYGIPFIWLIAGVGSLFIIVNFYKEFEPSLLIESQEKTASTFLWGKIQQHCASFFLLLLPLTISVIAFSLPQVMYYAIFLLVSSIILCALNITKYAAYEPDSEASTAYVFIYALFVGGIILPIFLPVSLFFIIRKYPAAISNLNLYLT